MNLESGIQNSEFNIQNSQFSLPRYPRYRDSGVEWLGDVPAHWEVKPGRTCLSLNKERNSGNIENTVLSLSYGNIVVKPPEKLTGLVPESFEGYQIINPGDIVIRPTDLQNDFNSLRVGLSKNRGIITSAYLGLKHDEKASSEFLYYLLHAYDLLKVYYGMGTGLRQNLDWRDFKYLPLALPTKPEQDRIVAFLDEKTAEIDALISKKQRQIELLDEQKAILINRAVTRGLNPSAKLKPSGIDWIGEIPAHWEVKRIGHLGKVGNGSTPSTSNPRYWDRSDYPWLNSGSVNRSVITEADQFVSTLALKECHLPLVKDRSIVVAITGQGKTRGTAALLMIPATINQHLAYIEIQTPAALPEFVHLSLTSQYFQLRAISESGSTKGALTCQDVKEFKIALPPVEEQRVIISTSDQIQKELAILAAKFDSQIQSLQTLRSTLIAHAVTGRIKV
jgi:type I restriction enzyme S subunit